MNRMQGGGEAERWVWEIQSKAADRKTGKGDVDDVAGIDEAKEELEEIVEFLRNPQKFSKLGGKIPLVLYW